MNHLLVPTLYFMSQPEALRFNPATYGGQWLLIGITDLDSKNQPQPLAYPFADQYAHIERLSFYDTYDCDGLTTADVQRVHAAIANAVHHQYHIAVHCFMGVSRSAAIARYVSEHTVAKDLDRYREHNKTVLNKFKTQPVLEGAAAYRVSAYPRKRAYVCFGCGGLGCEQCHDGYLYLSE